MRPSAAEALKAAIRRAIPLTIVLVVFGIVAMTVLKQVQGPRYSASAKVALQTQNLGAMLTGIDPGFQDPEREVETALALARSPEVYRRAAERLPGSELSSSDLRAMTTVSGRKESDIINFTTRTDEQREAITVANAVGTSYVDWRADISAGAIRAAIRRVQREIASGNGPKAALQADLLRLQTLETLNSGGATVIERPTKATQVSPAPVRDAMLGGAIGLVVALLIAAAREALNTRVRSEGDVEDMLNKPVLATIQTLPRRVGLVTVGRHETRFGDTYGLLAANLMQIRGEKSGRVLAVTSAIAGEGKTTTATNLAVALALRGHNVVLADFDVRKPSLGGFFRIPEASPGVRQLVDGQANVEDALWAVPLNGAAPSGRAQAPGTWSENGSGHSTDEPGWLRVVPSGGHERGARVARSPRVPALLADFGEDADLVILDTPPALATVEMAELAPHVDFVLVVVRHGRVTRRSLQTLSRQAESWRAEIVGAVITDSPPESDDYYYATK
ncbi:MAG TPA: P-loop NTPase [Gaiellaceae bacterium]|nr:P-loop NTPase [Gaiellaceae bacterium]